MDPEPKQYPPQSLVIEYDGKGSFRWTMTGNMPTMALVGTLELLKASLVDQEMARIAQARELNSRIIAAAMPVPRIKL